eukprot:66162-Chlamydomonas_euryale.AAC.1
MEKGKEWKKTGAVRAGQAQVRSSRSYPATMSRTTDSRKGKRKGNAGVVHEGWAQAWSCRS